MIIPIGQEESNTTPWAVKNVIKDYEIYVVPVYLGLILMKKFSQICYKIEEKLKVEF